MEIWSNKWFQEAKTEKLIQLVKDRIARNDLVQKTKTHVGLQCLSVIQSIASTMLIPTLYQFESPHGALTTGQTTDQDADNSMKYIINVPLFYHVSAVVKLSIKQQRTLGERLFVELQPAGPATDRPTDRRPTVRPSQHRCSCFLCLAYTWRMVQKIPSCYWMLLMLPSRFKFVKIKLPCFKFKRISKLCASAWTRNQNSATLTASYR